MELENEDRLTRMFEESRITTRLRGPREPPSYQSIFRPSPKLDKGKAKMSGYEEPIDNASTQSLDREFEILDRWSKESIRICKQETRPLDRQKNPVSRYNYKDYMAYHYNFMMKVISVREQETLSEAVKDPRWIAALNEEMETLCKNDTWDLIPHTPHKKAIGCWWIYKVKHNADALIDRLKARLNAKGYAQMHDIAYEETFAPVAKMSIVRTVISLQAAKRWHLHQMDVKNVFLQGKLEEEVYTRLWIVRSSKRRVRTQEASLQSQTSITCVAIEDHVVSSSDRISNVKIRYFPIHRKRVITSTYHHKARYE